MSVPLRTGDLTRLGDYRLVGRLGAGGMGTVYLGRGPDERPVAVKVLRSELAWDTELRGRFRSEVNRLRQVPPFCTAAVLDADPDHETPYLVVEYVEGPSLAELVRENGPLGPGMLHSVAIGVTSALVAIHGAGVIHRDLKPSNVLVATGGIKVIDFGIARPLELTSRHTRTDQMLGTVEYMAPERFDSGREPASTAIDVFAWGVLMAWAATGRTPFAADTAPATAMRVCTQPPDLTGLTGPLRALVERALAKRPADRPTARELLDALLGVAEPLPPRPVVPAQRPRPQPPAPQPAGPRPPERRHSHRAFVALMVATGLLGTALTTVVFWEFDTRVNALDQPAGRAEATPAAMLELLSRQLPGRSMSEIRSKQDPLSVRFQLAGTRGPGMVTVSVEGGGTPPERTGEPAVTTSRDPADCTRDRVVRAAWPDGAVVEVALATCLAADGGRTRPAPAPLSESEANGIARDPRWALSMEEDLVTAGERNFPDHV